ncbi:MAG: gluconate 2-dehydrogenase subunit 3 family protein [Thermomicrobiales bacterium]
MNEVHPDSPQEAPEPQHRFSRRGFLTASSVTLASTGLATIGAAAVHPAAAAPPAQATPVAGAMPDMANASQPAEFFNMHEAATVDAIASRLMPGDADDPGAHEAGVVFYIDRTLSGTNLGYSLKTYTQGPYLVVEEQPVSVTAASRRDNYDVVNVPADQVSRYGYQSVLPPQEIYRRGLAFVDAYAQDQFQKDFVDLTTDQQDQILTDMDEDKATGFEGPGARAFFVTLRNDTIEGMFSDPMYGGNRDLVGWKLIGYPGAQRLYTPDDILNPSFSRSPQSLAQLMMSEGH